HPRGLRQRLGHLAVQRDRLTSSPLLLARPRPGPACVAGPGRGRFSSVGGRWTPVSRSLLFPPGRVVPLPSSDCCTGDQVRLVWPLVTSAQSSAQSYQSTSIITSENPDRTWAPGLCVWCAGDHGVEVFAGEPRCSRCREHETVIAEARRFIGMYGLRPLGGSLDSDDEEEREYRVGARDARAALNAVRLAEQPTRDQIRRAVESGPSAVARVEAHVIADDEDEAEAEADTAEAAADTAQSEPVAESAAE